MLSKTKLSEMVNTRLCHDLAGPIGAVHNCTEYLDEDNPDIQEKAKSLLNSSAQQLLDRINFLRQLYGMSAESGEMNYQYIIEIVEKYFGSLNINFNWSLDALHKDNNLSPMHGKILMNIIQAAAANLIKGGEISVTILPEKNIIFHVVAKDKNIKFNDVNDNLILGLANIEDLKSSNVNFYYTAELLKNMSMKVDIKRNENMIEYLSYKA